MEKEIQEEIRKKVVDSLIDKDAIAVGIVNGNIAYNMVKKGLGLD